MACKGAFHHAKISMKILDATLDEGADAGMVTIKFESELASFKKNVNQVVNFLAHDFLDGRASSRDFMIT